MAGVDAAYAVTREENIVTIHGPKLRAAGEPEAFLVSFDFDGEHGPVRLRYEGAAPERPRGRRGETKLAKAMRMAVEFLRARPGLEAARGEIARALGDSSIGSRTVDEAIRALGDRGALAKTERYGWWRLVEDQHGA
jgi:hypothetical protein